MKLSDYARKSGVSYRTAWNWYKSGQLKGYQMPSGTIIVDDEAEPSQTQGVAIYARVSSAENRPHLDSQAERLVVYCTAKGYQVKQIVKEVGSGVNDHRPKLLAMLEDETVNRIVVEHKDRLAIVGFQYIETLLAKQNRYVEVVNLAEDGKEDLLQDLSSIIYSLCARLYGQRRAKRKTEQITAALQLEQDPDAVS